MAHLHGKIVKFLQINFGIQIIFGIFADIIIKQYNINY